ncbi:hypothetical protein HPB49_024226 [Dermacentor silvarum]|uniref:Uncharacterized protein n=1 Tax=Dermacentor silvarum TaxID=543639 RepID=A0ACB8E3Q9_DERSI|nr:hypothetical protein HPB49_024226 [Dermacentor silvarum]
MYRHDLSNCIPAFDGRKNLYTQNQLNYRERTFSVDLNEDQRIQKLIVKIQYAATVNLDTLHTVYQNRVNTVPQEVLQAIDIVIRHRPSMKMKPVGRSFFKAPPPPHKLNALDGGREVWFSYYMTVRPAQWKPMLNVTHLPYPPKCDKVVCVTKESAKEIFFSEGGKRTSVAEYFRKRYSRLAYPHFPCVQSGSLERPVYIPLEVCEMVDGQHCRKKLDENQTAEMIKRTAKPPSKRFQQAARGHVEASWPALLQAGHYGPLDIGQPDPVRAARQPRKLQDANPHWPRAGHAHRPACSRYRRPTTTGTTNYAEIKQVAETELGLRTQCLLENNLVKRRNPALVQNLCQKINAKTDGTKNSLLAQEKPALFQKPVIIISADVSHPSPGDRIRPSIAACVGSLDSIPSKFHAAVRIQTEHAEAKARVEIIRDLKEMVKDMLKAFF